MNLNPRVIEAAKDQFKLLKIWASVQLAQYALESAWGHLTTGTYNFFGIKAVQGQPFTEKDTHEYINGRYTPIRARFANYNSIEDAFHAHALLLATHPAYKNALSKKTAEEFAQALTGVYATDPMYGEKLINLMRRSSLEQYDT